MSIYDALHAAFRLKPEATRERGLKPEATDDETGERENR